MLTLSSADWNALIALFFYPFVRIMAWLSVDPLLGNRAAPNSVRVALAFILVLVIAPTLPPQPQVELVSGPGLLILVQQILIGVALGFALKIVIMAMEFAGHIMGLQMGLSFASLFDPINGAQTAVLSQLLVISAALILFAFNGHHLVLAALWQSFHDVPIGNLTLSGQGLMALVQWGGTIFMTGLHIALPVTAALLAANLAIGMMTRAAPQLNIFAVGFPITLAAGFLVLYFAMIYMPAFLDGLWLRALDAGSAAIQGLVGP
jgi:flagellar biosynthetic protein FliR